MDYQVKEEIREVLEELMESYSVDRLQRLKTILIYQVDSIIKKDELNDQKRKITIEEINSIVNTFSTKYANQFWYNKYINAFYHYYQGNINIVNSDLITVKSTDLIPDKLMKHKTTIQKSIRDTIKSNNFENIPLTTHQVKIVKSIFNSLFFSPNVTDYFLTIIGSFLNKNDNEFISNPPTHIWYGDQIEYIIEYLKQIIYDITKIYPKGLLNIKNKYNNYPFNETRLIYFKKIDIKKLYEKFKKYKEHIIILSSKMYTEYQNNNSYFNEIEEKYICNLNKFSDKEEIFIEYANKNINEDPMGNFNMKELLFDYTKYLKSLNLPNGLITKSEIKKYINNYCKSNSSSTIHNFCIKNLNKFALFKVFTEKNLSQEKGNIISLQQINYYFKKWYKANTSLYNDKYISKKEDIKFFMDYLYKDHEKNSSGDYIDIIISHFPKKKILYDLVNKNSLENDIIEDKLSEITAKINSLSNKSEYPLFNENDIRFHFF
tara:strand:- start:1660 stop:3129 length:1470 start_codon:yes stop_codon:yes gene_type:complete